jgi:hypothetical protein
MGPATPDSQVLAAIGACVNSSVDAFNDADVPFGRSAKSLERSMVSRTVMRSDRLSDAVEFDQYRALIDACLICLCRATAGEEAAAAAIMAGPPSLAYSASAAGSEIVR